MDFQEEPGKVCQIHKNEAFSITKEGFFTLDKGLTDFFGEENSIDF